MNSPSSLGLPSWWSGAGIDAKIAFIKIRFHCTYEQACAMLGSRGRSGKRAAIGAARISVSDYQKDLQRKGID